VSQSVAKVIVDTLQAAGVKNCYGIVGDTVNKIAGYIQDSEIDWVHVRHEEAGAFAAQAEALLTDRLTAMAGSCGPGSLHFINGLYEGYRNRAPTILIATQVPSSELGFRFIQEVDFKKVYADCTVFCDQIYTPEQALRKTVLACQTAIARRGPAVLIVPVDISHAQMQDKTPFRVHAHRPVLRPNDTDIETMAQLINKGEKIALYAGSGCQNARAQVLALAEKIKAPVAHTSRAKDVMEWANPHNVGMTGLLGNEAGYHTVLQADTLVLLGADFAWRQFYPDKATIVQVDDDPTHIGQRHPVDLGLTGDIGPTLEALLPRVKARAKSSFYDKSVALHRKVIDAHDAKAKKPGPNDLIPGKYAATVIDRLAAEDTVFVADDGTVGVWMLRHIPANGKRRMFASLLHGTMAGGMTSAIGAQKAQPGRQVIALCGDGGFSMLMGDLLTLVQEELPVKIAIFDNTKLGFVEIEQKTEGMLATYTDLKNPDFGEVAKAMGLAGRTVERAADLEANVKAWLAEPGPSLLHIKVETLELVMPPFTEAEPAIGMALYTARTVLHGQGGDVLEMIKENL
jgi:pyruvate dehydrogenase (quinone)